MFRTLILIVLLTTLLPICGCTTGYWAKKPRRVQELSEKFKKYQDDYGPEREKSPEARQIRGVFQCLAETLVRRKSTFKDVVLIFGVPLSDMINEQGQRELAYDLEGLLEGVIVLDDQDRYRGYQIGEGPIADKGK